MNFKYVECECYCGFHTLRFSWEDDPEHPEVYVSVFLNNSLSFFKRVALAFRFVFGIKTPTNYFCETILNYNKVKELKDLFDNFLNNHLKTPRTEEEKIKIAKMVVSLRKKSLDVAIEKLKRLEDNDKS